MRKRVIQDIRYLQRTVMMANLWNNVAEVPHSIYPATRPPNLILSVLVNKHVRSTLVVIAKLRWHTFAFFTSFEVVKFVFRFTFSFHTLPMTHCHIYLSSQIKLTSYYNFSDNLQLSSKYSSALFRLFLRSNYLILSLFDRECNSPYIHCC